MELELGYNELRAGENSTTFPHIDCGGNEATVSSVEHACVLTTCRKSRTVQYHWDLLSAVREWVISLAIRYTSTITLAYSIASPPYYEATSTTFDFWGYILISLQWKTWPSGFCLFPLLVGAALAVSLDRDTSSFIVLGFWKFADFDGEEFGGREEGRV